MKTIVKHELKNHWKPFFFWSLGLAVLIFAGLAKFLGFEASSSADVSAMMAQFPKAFLALFGLAGVDIQSLPGYFGVLEYYALLCTVIYAVTLGNNAVSRETIDKTYEFLFTKPRSRNTILAAKLLAAVLYLIAFCLLNLISSHIALVLFKFENSLATPILLFTLANFAVGIFYLCLSAFFSAFLKRAEMGAKISSLAFLLSYILAIVFDFTENANIIKIFTPLRYFTSSDLLQSKFSIGYLFLLLGFSAIALQQAFRAFRARDLSAL